MDFERFLANLEDGDFTVLKNIKSYLARFNSPLEDLLKLSKSLEIGKKAKYRAVNINDYVEEAHLIATMVCEKKFELSKMISSLEQFNDNQEEIGLSILRSELVGQKIDFDIYIYDGGLVVDPASNTLLPDRIFSIVKNLYTPFPPFSTLYKGRTVRMVGTLPTTIQKIKPCSEGIIGGYDVVYELHGVNGLVTVDYSRVCRYLLRAGLISTKSIEVRDYAGS